MPMGVFAGGLQGQPQRMKGLLPEDMPQQPQAMPQQPQGGGGLLDSLSSLFASGEPNYGLAAVGAGISSGDMAGAFKDYAPIMALGKSKNKTRQWLVSKGMSPEDAEVYASDPALLREVLKGQEEHKRNLINVGNGKLYDADTGETIDTGAGGGDQPTAIQEYEYGLKNPGFMDFKNPKEGKAPTVRRALDANGNEVDQQWNADTNAWDVISGVKKSRDKVDDYVKKNQSNAFVMDPELKNLIGDGTKANPGKFDSLAGLGSQAGSQGAGIVKSLTGGNVDLSGYMTGADYQSAKASLQVIVQSYLYSVSGQAAPAEEVNKWVSSLMPVPGDTTVAEKKARIKTLVDAVKMAASGAGGAETVPPPEGGGNDGWTVEEVP